MSGLVSKVAYYLQTPFTIYRVPAHIEDDTVTEIFFHPAYVDDELRKYSSLLVDREEEI